MTLEETIDQFKNICKEEAIHFRVPNALIEIYLIRYLYSRKKKRHLVTQYLKDCHLSRLLKVWNGSFKVLQDKSTPTFMFKDGTEVAIGARRDVLARYKWNDFIQYFHMFVLVETKEKIKKRLKERLENIGSTYVEQV